MLQPRILDLSVTSPTTDTGSTISNAVRPTSSAVASTNTFVSPAGSEINFNPPRFGVTGNIVSAETMEAYTELQNALDNEIDVDVS